MFVRIDFVVILSHDNGVTLEEPVGLVVRQEHPVGRIIDVYRASFCDFSGTVLTLPPSHICDVTPSIYGNIMT